MAGDGILSPSGTGSMNLNQCKDWTPPIPRLCFCGSTMGKARETQVSKYDQLQVLLSPQGMGLRYPEIRTLTKFYLALGMEAYVCNH